MPEIGEQYEEIFREIVKVNTLDKDMYREIQQHLIDALDQAENGARYRKRGKTERIFMCRCIRWKIRNIRQILKTVLRMSIFRLERVFTSPKLAGTYGTLHVSEVFLNELGYKDLCLTFEDGMIKDYTCKNFEMKKTIKSM